ncbi:unnamed protein product [Lepidochelys kempii]
MNFTGWLCVIPWDPLEHCWAFIILILRDVLTRPGQKVGPRRHHHLHCLWLNPRYHQGCEPLSFLSPSLCFFPSSLYFFFFLSPAFAFSLLSQPRLWVFFCKPVNKEAAKSNALNQEPTCVCGSGPETSGFLNHLNRHRAQGSLSTHHYCAQCSLCVMVETQNQWRLQGWAVHPVTKLQKTTPPLLPPRVLAGHVSLSKRVWAQHTHLSINQWASNLTSHLHYPELVMGIRKRQKEVSKKAQSCSIKYRLEKYHWT